MLPRGTPSQFRNSVGRLDFRTKPQGTLQAKFAAQRRYREEGPCVRLSCDGYVVMADKFGDRREFRNQSRDEALGRAELRGCVFMPDGAPARIVRRRRAFNIAFGVFGVHDVSMRIRVKREPVFEMLKEAARDERDRDRLAIEAGLISHPCRGFPIAASGMGGMQVGLACLDHGTVAINQERVAERARVQRIDGLIHRVRYGVMHRDRRWREALSLVVE